jgi:putative transposase
MRVLIVEKAAQLEITVHALEILPDHVHLFVESDTTRSVAEIVNYLKGYTSRVLRKEFSWLRSQLPCLWSRSYYAGTVGHFSESVIRKYIATQQGR